MLHHWKAWVTGAPMLLILFVFVPLGVIVVNVARHDPKLRKYLPEVMLPAHEKV